jgi:ornithine cyclodeaminase/alanine dehydrogenase-like protein (mu-crystallin family)
LDLTIISHQDVIDNLTIADCIPIMREAMTALSNGETKQLPREILPAGKGMLGIMPGALAPVFGAKIVSAFSTNAAIGLPSHQGAVMLFDPDNGALLALVDAHAITRIRTAAASAVATNALARADASHLAILGYGEQAHAHIEAMCLVRDVSDIRIWGRSEQRRAAFADRVRAETNIPVSIHSDVTSAVRDADIICTTTSAQEPILFGSDVAPGAHVNVVGSSHAVPSEVDVELVVQSRFFADHRPSVLAQGAEFQRARNAGLVDDSHLLGEIGEVLRASIAGRLNDQDITIYKSLGQFVQDLASSLHIYKLAQANTFGTRVKF